MLSDSYNSVTDLKALVEHNAEFSRAAASSTEGTRQTALLRARESLRRQLQRLVLRRRLRLSPTVLRPLPSGQTTPSQF
jgi:hypothetical protein